MKRRRGRNAGDDGEALRLPPDVYECGIDVELCCGVVSAVWLAAPPRVSPVPPGRSESAWPLVSRSPSAASKGVTRLPGARYVPDSSGGFATGASCGGQPARHAARVVRTSLRHLSRALLVFTLAPHAARAALASALHCLVQRPAADGP